jgi:hypothetical protein
MPDDKNPVPPSNGEEVQVPASEKPDLLNSRTKSKAIVSKVIKEKIAEKESGFDETLPSFSDILKEPDDPVLGVLDTVVKGIKDGTDLAPVYTKIARLINNQEERAELINNLSLTHDYERKILYMKACWALERYMFKLIGSGKLKPHECMAFMRLIQEELQNIDSTVKAGGTSPDDVMAMLNKVDFTFQMKQEELESKFKNTTPQGREIVRRLGFKLMKAAKVMGKKGAKKESVKDSD